MDSFWLSGMSFQVATWYGANRAVLATATFMPTSTTSGARSVPACCLIALTSSWLLPFGFAELTVIPGYLALKPSMIAP